MNEIQSFGDLLDLQSVDLDIDRLLHTRANLPVLDEYKAANAAKVAAERDHDNLAAELATASRALDKAEGELEILEDKLQREEQRLFAGGMSARETENMRNEVTSLRAKQSGMEDEVLSLIDSRETLEAQAGTAKALLDECAETEAEFESAVGQEWKKIDAELARREGSKSEIVPLIPPELLDMYERMRQTKEGVAIGRLIDGVCGGCHLTLSAAEQLEVAGDDPPRCLHCRRLLVL